MNRLFIKNAVSKFVAPTLSMLFLANSYACETLAPGSTLHTDNLINEAEVIVLVTLEKTDTRPWSQGTKKLIWTLRAVETLKGTPQATYSFQSHRKNHAGKDFNNHHATAFWKPWIGRSEWGGCMPDPTFRSGENYLLFPDKLGAAKSAEIIRSPNDKWLRYVRAKLKQQ